MRPIPTLFKRNSDKLTDTPTNALAVKVLEGADGWTPRRELTAKASFLLDADGDWWQYRLLHSRDKRPTLFVETYKTKHKTYGWIPAKDGSAYAFLLGARSRGEVNEVPGSTYALVEKEDGDGFTVIRHADAEVCKPLNGKLLTYKMLHSFFKEAMPNLGWEGIVWHGPGGEMLRLGVSDFR